MRKIVLIRLCGAAAAAALVDNVSLDKTSAVVSHRRADPLSCTSSRRALIRLKRAKKCETWVTFDETVDIQRIHGGIDRKLRPENNFGEHLFLKMCMGTLTQPEERTRRKLLTGESFWNTNKEKHCEFCGKGRIRIDGLLLEAKEGYRVLAENF